MLPNAEKMGRRPWAASLLGAVAVGAVIWHVLACVESPMSFSPSGDLALTLMDPWELSEHLYAGSNTYSLMIIGKDRVPREVERARDFMLTGPAYDSGGRWLAYVRIGLPTREGEAQAEEFLKRLTADDPKVVEGALREGWFFATPAGLVQRNPRPLHVGAEDIGLLPGRQVTPEMDRLRRAGPVLPADLVVRDVLTGNVMYTVPLDIPLLVGAPTYFTYAFSRPQWLTDGKRICIYLNGHLAIVSVPSGKVRLFNSPGIEEAEVTAGLLSPSGNTLAMLGDDLLQLTATTGDRTTLIRVTSEIRFPTQLAWIGPETLAVLRVVKPESDEEKVPGATSSGERLVMSQFNSGGKLVQERALPIAVPSSKNIIELAIAPNGKHMVVSFGDRVHFLDGDGKARGEWRPPDEGQLLVRPTFAQDSKLVALRFIRADKEGSATASTTRNAAVVFFDPRGKELYRVDLPKSAPAQQPARVEGAVPSAVRPAAN